MVSFRTIIATFYLCSVTSSAVRLFTSRSMYMKKALCRSLVICGPSGVGKGTLIGKLLASYPDKVGLSVSHTSRKPREGEIDGVHYNFVDKEFILQDIKTGPIKFIEHAEVHSNIYGTRGDAVEKVHDDGKLCILDVDRKGVQQIKLSHLPAKYVFITPDSLAGLESRLRARGTETEEQIQLRLKNAIAEMEYGESGEFDEVLVNENLEQTYNTLVSHMRVWFPTYDF